MPLAREDLDSNWGELAGELSASVESWLPWSTWKERKTWRDWGRSRSFTVVYGGLNARDSERAGQVGIGEKRKKHGVDYYQRYCGLCLSCSVQCSICHATFGLSSKAG